mmetsp:Transcript_9887/g.60289  ORF Transcript_9887/g.60289 Transcript_9887/m.60289 type:complete len:233 (-) Transcript_9887:657-1355(-)
MCIKALLRDGIWMGTKLHFHVSSVVCGEDEADGHDISRSKLALHGEGQVVAIERLGMVVVVASHHPTHCRRSSPIEAVRAGFRSRQLRVRIGTPPHSFLVGDEVPGPWEFEEPVSFCCFPPSEGREQDGRDCRGLPSSSLGHVPRLCPLGFALASLWWSSGARLLASGVELTPMSGGLGCVSVAGSAVYRRGTCGMVASWFVVRGACIPPRVLDFHCQGRVTQLLSHPTFAT